MQWLQERVSCICAEAQALRLYAKPMPSRPKALLVTSGGQQQTATTTTWTTTTSTTRPASGRGRMPPASTQLRGRPFPTPRRSARQSGTLSTDTRTRGPAQSQMRSSSLSGLATSAESHTQLKSTATTTTGAQVGAPSPVTGPQAQSLLGSAARPFVAPAVSSDMWGQSPRTYSRPRPCHGCGGRSRSCSAPPPAYHHCPC